MEWLIICEDRTTAPQRQGTGLTEKGNVMFCPGLVISAQFSENIADERVSPRS